MTEASESGAGLAWRLLATLEGGTLILTTTAFLAHTIKNIFFSYQTDRHQTRVPVKNVIISNTSSRVGYEIKTTLELRGCHVTSGEASGARSGAGSKKYNAIVIVGAEASGNRLEDLSNLVSEDIYSNLKILESLCAHLEPGGYIVWVATNAPRIEATSGAFSGASRAFDNVLRSQVNMLAKSCYATPVWISRSEAARVAERVAAKLLPCDREINEHSYSLRYFVAKISSFIYRRWMKLLN